MALIKTKEEIGTLHEAGRRLSAVLTSVVAATKPGVTTFELDQLAEKLIRDGGDTPAFLNYQPKGAPIPFPGTLCTSVNDEVVHGIPKSERVLQEGDIIGLDVGLVHEGLIVDMAVTVPVGGIDKVDDKTKKLLQDTRGALMMGIKQLKPGNTLGDVGAAIAAVADKAGYGLVEDLGGHGVGHEVHEPPFVANFGTKGQGEKLEEGMVLALEPMFNLGGKDVELEDDDYTFTTRDSSLSAHFELTVAVGKNGPDIITTPVTALDLG